MRKATYILFRIFSLMLMTERFISGQSFRYKSGMAGCFKEYSENKAKGQIVQTN